VASAQGQADKESLIEGVVTNLNAYWDEQFQVFGGSYSPPELVFLYDQELVLGPCGLAFTSLGPSYCPYDGTLYYPIDWIGPATGLRLEDYGESAVEMVVAHEMAHHAQLQMQNFGILGVESIPGTQMELEADCLAGVYANREITQPAGIEAALAALGEAGGPGHGTSQQRIAAFELGYTTGDEARCLSLGNSRYATTQVAIAELRSECGRIDVMATRCSKQTTSRTTNLRLVDPWSVLLPAFDDAARVGGTHE
jgi:predicted metalloprotease